MADEPFVFFSHEKFSELPKLDKLTYIRRALDVLAVMGDQAAAGGTVSRHVTFLDQEQFHRLSQSEKIDYIRQASEVLHAERVEIFRSVLSSGRKPG